MIKMIASRRYYRTEDGREYEAGEEFSVATEREAARLVARRRARLTVPGPYADRAMTAEPPDRGAELEHMLEPPPAPKRRGRPPKSSYERRDMQARED